MRRFDYAKNIVFSVAILFFTAALLSGCCTCGKLGADAANVVSGNSHAVGRLEATVAALDGTVADSRARIASIIKTSRNIADGVERIEFLFCQYESEIERILREIDRIRNETEIQSENYNNSGGGSDSISGSPGRSACFEN